MPVLQMHAGLNSFLHSQAALPDSTHDSHAEAKAADQVLQGIAHTQLPYYGVQFHPESIGTAFGRQLLQNFHDITADWHGYQIPPHDVTPSKGAFQHCCSRALLCLLVA